MNPTLETTQTKYGRGTMTFTDDRNDNYLAVVNWTYVIAGSRVIITSIHINAQTGYQMPECHLIHEAYEHIKGEYSFVDFECRGAVTIEENTLPPTEPQKDYAMVAVPSGYQLIFENMVAKLESMMDADSVNVANTGLLHSTSDSDIQEGFDNATKNAAFYLICAKQIENLA